MRVTRVTSQSTLCSSCHGFINDVGYGFENYGALGEWQTLDNGLPVDVSGVLNGTEHSDGAFNGARELATRLSTSSEVRACYTKQWLRFALGRVEQPRDSCELEALSQAFAASGGDIRALIRSIALSRAFAFKDTGSMPSGTGGGSAGGSAGGGTAGTGGGAAAGGSSGAGGGTVMPTTLLMASGAELRPDQSVTTSDGTHRLIYQLDGNLVFERLGVGPVMSSGTAGTSPGFAVMQGDGNFVVYDATGMARFHTSTHGNPGAQLHFEAGRLHIITPAGVRRWSAP